MRTRAKGKRRWHAGLWVRFALVVSLFSLVSLGLGLGMRLGYKWLQSTPLLSVRDIGVDCDDQRVRERALRFLHDYRGKNLLSIDADALKEGLMRNDPWIAWLEVSRDFPHGLRVDIESRHAVAFLKWKGRLYLVDSKGRFFVPVSHVESKGLVEIKGIGPQGDATLISGFLRLVETRGKILCYKNIESIDVKDGSMTVITRGNNIPLRFSLARPLKVQFRRAEAILYHLYSSGKYKYVKSIDLWLGKDKAIVAMRKNV